MAICMEASDSGTSADTDSNIGIVQEGINVAYRVVHTTTSDQSSIGRRCGGSENGLGAMKNKEVGR